MKRIITKTASVLLAVVMLTSCTSEGGMGENINKILERLANTEESAQVEVVEENGVETVEISNTISVGVTGVDTWNPLLTASPTVKEAMEFVYEPLYEIKADHSAEAVLAADYWLSPDGKTIEITLKDGVKWQDGDSLDAYDVAYTVKQILNGNTSYTSLLADVADYRALNASVIRFVLRRSVPDFTSLLTFPIVKYKSSMTSSTVPMGTGPYSFYGKVSTDKYMLIANDIYHGGRPLIDAVYVTVAPDLEKYHLMFEASEFDLMTDSTVEIENGMPVGNLTVYDYVTDKMCYIGFNTGTSVLGGAATRRGMAYLIDKDAIASKLLYSRGVAVDVPINPGSYLYYDISKSFGIEYENAYDEFEADGWQSKERGFTREKDGITEKLKIELLVNSDNAKQVDIAKYIEADMERYGVAVELEEQPYDIYLSRINSHDYEAFIGEVTLNANGDVTPLTGNGNCFSYSSAAVNTIITQCGMTRDIEQRKALFIQLGQELVNDAPFVPLYYSKGCVIAGTKIKNVIEPSVSADYRYSYTWRVK